MLLISCALAAYVTDVGEDVTLALGGNFARVVVADDGAYRLFWSAGGDYNHLPLGDDFSINDQQRVSMTGHTDLIDHAIRRCEDGTYLHSASANVTTPNDTAWVFTYDAELRLLSEVLLNDQDPQIRHNDMMLWCGRDRLVGFSTYVAEHWVFELEGDGTERERTKFSTYTQFMGGQFWQDDEGLFAVGVTYTHTAQLTRWDNDLTLTDETEIPGLAPDGKYAYWPQGFERIGDHFVVVHMARSDDEGFSQDTGNVYLTILRADDLQVVEQTQLTDYTPSEGAMRPWLARDGADLILSWDRSLAPHVMRVSLDLAALGEGQGPDDTGGDDTAGDSATDTNAPPPDTDSEISTGACGCGTGVAPSVAGLLVGSLLLTRRRTPRVRG